MRLFLALAFDDRFLDAATARSDALREISRTGNFGRRESLHLTLAFLGEVSFERVAPLCRALATIPFPPLSLSLGGFVRFGTPPRRIVGLSVAGGDALVGLAAAIRAVLSEIGQAYDPKPFHAHVTLARECDADDAALSAIGEPPACETTAVAFALFESLRTDGRLVYKKLRVFPARAAKP